MFPCVISKKKAKERKKELPSAPTPAKKEKKRKDRNSNIDTNPCFSISEIWGWGREAVAHIHRSRQPRDVISIARSLCHGRPPQSYLSTSRWICLQYCRRCSDSTDFLITYSQFHDKIRMNTRFSFLENGGPNTCFYLLSSAPAPQNL